MNNNNNNHHKTQTKQNPNLASKTTMYTKTKNGQNENAKKE